MDGTCGCPLRYRDLRKPGSTVRYVPACLPTCPRPSVSLQLNSQAVPASDSIHSWTTTHVTSAIFPKDFPPSDQRPAQASSFNPRCQAHTASSPVRFIHPTSMRLEVVMCSANRMSLSVCLSRVCEDSMPRGPLSHHRHHRSRPPFIDVACHLPLS